MAVGLSEKRVLLLNDYRPLFSELANRLRTVGASVVVAKDVTTASWYTDSERLDTVLTFFDRERPRDRLGELIRQVRQSRTNARTPIQVVADDLDAESVKQLAALGVANIIMAPKSAEDLLRRLERTLLPRAAAPSYDVRLINCFLAGAREILTFYLGGPPDVGKPRVKQGKEAAGFVTGLIAFTVGGHLGSLAATFDRAFVDLLAVKMLGDAAGLDDAGYADLAGEMCNQILGKATLNFERLGVGLRMGLPEVLIGIGHTVVHKLDGPVIAIPMGSGDTACLIEFAMSPDVTAEFSAR